MACAEIKMYTITQLEAEPNIQDILSEYATESSIKGLPTPSAKVELYKQMEGAGALHSFAAFVQELLIGYITVLSPVLPHYGRVVAVAESFFVAKAYRKTGAGLSLLRAAEAYAEEIGSPGLLVSAPINGNLAEVLPYVGYEETNAIFFRRFGHA